MRIVIVLLSIAVFCLAVDDCRLRRERHRTLDLVDQSVRVSQVEASLVKLGTETLEASRSSIQIADAQVAQAYHRMLKLQACVPLWKLHRCQ